MPQHQHEQQHQHAESSGLPPLPADLFDELCPSQLVPFRFGDKWAALIISCLEAGPRRYSELRVPLARVTPKALTQSLRRLERDGFISRTVRAEPPHAVAYALTPLGRSVLEPLKAAYTWTAEHWDELLDSQERSLDRSAESAGSRAVSSRGASSSVR